MLQAGDTLSKRYVFPDSYHGGGLKITVCTWIGEKVFGLRLRKPIRLAPDSDFHCFTAVHTDSAKFQASEVHRHCAGRSSELRGQRSRQDPAKSSASELKQTFLNMRSDTS